MGWNIINHSREGSLCSPPARLGRKNLVLRSCTHLMYKNGRYQLLHELKDKKMHTAGAGHTYSNLLLWDSQFSKIIYNSY